MRRFLGNFALFAIALAISLVSVEILIRSVDPSGGYVYFSDLRLARRATIADDDLGAAFLPGFYAMSSWAFEIGADGYRKTPNAPINAGCTVAIIGDSVTFGLGVDDGETYTALLQAGYPDVRLINAGMNGYNAGNFGPVADATPADGYVYYHIPNDAQPRKEWRPEQPAPLLWGWRVYLGSATPATAPDVDPALRAERYGDFLDRDNLLILTPNHDQWLIEAHGAIPVPMWTSYNSLRDHHPDALGHQQIADSIRGYVDGFIQEICTSNQMRIRH